MRQAVWAGPRGTCAAISAACASARAPRGERAGAGQHVPLQRFPNVAVTELAEADAVATSGEGDFTQFAPATILVADDVALNRALLTGYFEGTGHKVITPQRLGSVGRGGKASA